MNDVLARLSALAAAGLLAVSLAALIITSNPGISGTEVKAEFQNAYPLLPGMNVRVAGAIAGTVAEVEVTDEGTALITMQLNAGTPPPRTDAIATIRQEDITGDSYVSISLGRDEETLGESVIPPRQTMTAPRFDTLLNSFDEPVRQGLELLLVELGMALERRGEDLNRAALSLRPALSAANDALGELAERNHVLGKLVVDTEYVSGQVAARTEELADLIEGLSRVTEATADHLPALDRALETAPETVESGLGTLARLSLAAESSEPLALALADAAPQLADTATLLGPFAGDAAAILDAVEPALAATNELLVKSLPTIRSAPERLFTAPFDIAAGVGGLLDALIGQKDLVVALFGADTYGGQVPGDRSDDVGLGSVGVELGTQDGYPPDYDPERRFLRAVSVPSCEVFGEPVAPDCFVRVLSSGAESEPAPSDAPEPDSSDDGEGPAAGAGDPADPPADSPADGGDGGGEGALGELDDLLEGLGAGLPDDAVGGGDGAGDGEDTLFDFLFGS